MIIINSSQRELFAFYMQFEANTVRPYGLLIITVWNVKWHSVLFHPNTTSKIIITQKPIAKEKVETLLCVPRLASGTSSSTTT